jgi:hypothetical protein
VLFNWNLDAAGACYLWYTPAASAAAQRRRDFAGREPSGRHLVEQRLEEVKITAVDQRHLNRRASQSFGGVEPAEASPEDNHSMHLVQHRETTC